MPDQSSAEEPVVVPVQAPKEESNPLDLVLKVLGAVGTSLGILGFVTFFGAAIIWVRADKAELPATEAVAVVPRSVLVITGATFLLPAALIAAGVVAVVFLIHLIFRLFDERDIRSKRSDTQLLRHEAAQTGRAAVAAQLSWRMAQAGVTKRQEELTAAHAREAPAGEIAPLQAKITEERAEAERLQAAAEGAVSAASTKKGEAENLTEELEEKLERGKWQWVIELVVAVLALGFVVPAVNGTILEPSFTVEWLALPLVAIVGTAITLLVYWEKEKFVWFGIVAFIAVGVYLAAATYVSTHRNAKMQPVAALRAGHQPVTGAFIADTAENLYIGSFRETGKPPRLIVIPRSQVTEFAVGPLLDQSAAPDRAIAMALDECNQKVEEAKGENGATQVKPACSTEQEEALESAAETK